jgi:membrane associated rhomboid family serine protease
MVWVLGDNIEDAIGHVGYFFFYIACGVAAALAHTLAMPQSDVPLVGASGAVAGVIGAYLLLHPRVRIWVLILWRIPLPIPALIAFGLWIILQIVNAAMSSQEAVAWWAHIGGFFTGAVLIVFMRRKPFALLGMH